MRVMIGAAMKKLREAGGEIGTGGPSRAELPTTRALRKRKAKGSIGKKSKVKIEGT